MSRASGSGSSRRKREEEEAIIDEYRDMLVDTYEADPSMFVKDETKSRPRKRPGAGASVRRNPAAAAAGNKAAEGSSSSSARPGAESSSSKSTPANATTKTTTRKAASIEIQTATPIRDEASTRKRRRTDDYDGDKSTPQKTLPAKASPVKTSPLKSSPLKSSPLKPKDNADQEMTDLNDGRGEDDDEAVVSGEQSEYEYDDDDDDDDSDVDWENIDLNQPPAATIAPSLAPSSLRKLPSELTVDVSKYIEERDKANRRHRGNRRKPATPLERKIRLEIHKMHILCMLSHTKTRSEFCNDEVVQKSLRRVLDKSVINSLRDNNAYNSSSVLRTGLSDASFYFRRKFKIIRPGLRKPLWRDDEENEEGQKVVEYPPYGDDAISLEEFRAATANMEGSRDLAAQVFCAMLRGLGLTVRLVTSLQVLGYTFQKSGRKETNNKPKAVTKPGETLTPRRKMSQSRTSGGEFKGEVNPKFGGPGPKVAGKDVVSSKKVSPKTTIIKKPQILPTMDDPVYPVYWVEVFDVQAQEWITVDPIVTKTVKKPLQLEPPLSESHEIEMAYVVAFEAEGQAKDVTRRYVKFYNGRTRLLRVENTKDGGRWWRKALKPFRRGYPLDRDQIEEAALSQRELAEGVPNSIQAFKTHPVFALEQLCRRNEVIHPKRQVASVPAAKGKKGADSKPIPVYRRSDVKIVKTARQWYMLGREIKIGEQPLKIQVKKPNAGRSRRRSFDEDDNDEEVANQGMYAEHQTALYEPPAVMFGLIPKNNFGNIDVFVPSMVPSGAVHLTKGHKMLAKAAKALDIDYADAVVGFDHKGRAATAVIKGIVVAEEHVKELEEVVAEMEAEVAEEERLKKQIEMLKLWRKFLIGLRIIERLEEYGPAEGEEKLSSMHKGKMKILDDYNDRDEEVDEEREEAEEEAGGFFKDGEDEYMETGGGGLIPHDHNATATQGGGGFFLDGDEEEEQPADPDGGAGGFLKGDEGEKEDVNMHGGDFTAHDDAGEGGGFIPEGEAEDGGGGFVREGNGQPPMKERAEDQGNPFIVEEDENQSTSASQPDNEDENDEEDAEPLVVEHEDDEEIGEDDFEYDEDDGVDFDD